MKTKILKTLGVIVLLIVVGFVYNFIDYGASQEYAKVAVQQVNDDTAYYALRSRESITAFYRIFYWGVNLVIVSMFYFIWKPKEVTE